MEFDLIKITGEVEKNIVGQSNAITQIHNTIAINFMKRIKTKKIKGVLASFILVGKTGVGKTETAKQYALALRDFGWSFLRLDMSEFSQEHTVASLLGAPKGYIGSDTPGRLTGFLREHPMSIIVFDEVEKGHPKVYDILLQLLDEARLTDLSFGFTVNVPWSIVFLTSNLAQNEILEIEESDNDHVQKEILMKDVLSQNNFRPEILGRVDRIVPFVDLTDEHYLQITRMQLQKYRISDPDMSKSMELFKLYKPAKLYGVREYVRQIEKHILLFMEESKNTDAEN